MPTLDLAWVSLCGEFADNFEVIRRPETITQFGRAEYDPQPTIVAAGTCFPTGDNSLQRRADFEHSYKTMTLITPYRLRASSPGFQPDIVLYRGNTYIVSSVKDYSAFGAGFVEAELTCLEAQPTPAH